MYIGYESLTVRESSQQSEYTLNYSFDIYTSEFVVKGNGTYIFHLHVMSQENRECYAWIMVNNRHQLPVYGDARAG